VARRRPVLAAAALAAAVTVALTPGVAAPAPATANPGATPAAAALGAAPACDSSTPLSLLAMDTEAGRMLFSLDDPGGGQRLIEVTADGAEARLYAAAGSRHFAGSVGPGPAFAVRGCGDDCRQPEGWDGGAWRALGAPLTLPGQPNLFGTYDHSGAPWLIATRELIGGWLEARAFRWSGGSWHEEGRQPITGVTSQAAAPAGWQDDAVISGTGVFAAGAAPAQWVAGLPSLPPERRGQVLPLGRDGAVYLADDGGLYVGSQRGERWEASRWRPWGVERSAVWSFGSDYSFDLPQGALTEPLPVAWFDRRSPDRAQLLLTGLAAGGGWRLEAQLPPEVLADTGESVELVHLLRTGGGLWVLLSDCLLAGEQPGLARRTASAAGLSPPRFIPIVR
jgi:hypothetical protein